MKKHFKRFIAIAFAMMMLFAAPTSNALAAGYYPKPVITAQTVAATFCKFDPSPYILAPGEVVYLYAGNETWKVPQNKPFFFQCFFSNIGKFWVEVVDVSSGYSYYSSIQDSTAFSLNLDGTYALTNEEYVVRITNMGNSGIYIEEYMGMWY
jgi:hypothetical protein